MKALDPTSDTVRTTAPVPASRTATSTSGMVNPEGTAASQIFGVGCPSSTQCVPFHCTITPTSGAAGSVGSLGGLGGDGPPPARTLAALTIVVRFPHSWTLTNTCVPPGPTASARGCLPKMGVGEKAGAPVAGSNAFTWSSPLTHTKARVGVPANTTSVGSSPTRKVAFTLMERRSTTLTSSERWFTTQAVESSSAATETGSSPTGTSPREVRAPEPIENTSSRASGRFRARSFDPSGVSATGWTGTDSKFR